MKIFILTLLVTTAVCQLSSRLLKSQLTQSASLHANVKTLFNNRENLSKTDAANIRKEVTKLNLSNPKGPEPIYGKNGLLLNKALGYVDTSLLHGPIKLTPTEAEQYIEEARKSSRWQDFKKKFDRKFEDADYIEEAQKFATYQENLKTIAKLVKMRMNGLINFNVGETNFADVSPREFVEKQLCGVKYVSPSQLGTNTAKIRAYMSLHRRAKRSTSKNWVDQSKVTSVKNQKECSSCWAFTAAAAVESALAIKGSALTDLSEQNLIDCAVDYGSKGCDGGWVSPAFAYMKDKGVTTESTYPYTDSQGECSIEQGTTKIVAFEELGIDGDEEALMAEVDKAPVASAIHMAQDWQYYTGGIYSSDDCPNRCDSRRCYLNHSILIVGYGTENNVDYWLCKNSWGTDWGENGYIKLKRGANMCGIASKPTVVRV